jgi:hypothetical protein
MTALSASRPLRRETATVYRGRPLIVELHPGYLVLREKCTRKAVTVDYRTALELGYKLLARQAAIDKHDKKRRKRP